MTCSLQSSKNFPQIETMSMPIYSMTRLQDLLAGTPGFRSAPPVSSSTTNVTRRWCLPLPVSLRPSEMKIVAILSPIHQIFSSPMIKTVAAATQLVRKAPTTMLCLRLLDKKRDKALLRWVETLPGAWLKTPRLGFSNTNQLTKKETQGGTSMSAMSMRRFAQRLSALLDSTVRKNLECSPLAKLIELEWAHALTQMTQAGWLV